MSATNTGVPAPLDTTLPSPVPSEEHEHCPVTDILRRIGDKWTVLVIVLLGQRPHRFNELHQGIEAISQRMLTRTLRGLQEDGLVHREVFATVPPSVEYSLTPLGNTLLTPLSALATWAIENQPAIAASRHANSLPGQNS
ncbi:DNA-binding HxlR family transcriptional regulator [Lipingzhangella halophila]|uniref:DNA-binding HxlR family transcriptional regulator n=1 Tax=Lipingzhangella halophila TaxID=1783352 RepID=A0A7W7RD83_9ACTN|nr:helix-turn-helix domain-containing protein [Lipingzhangella halophila]MBB4929838.1 DNA-binding HxlR family transcriptional regulator [Lipingzhangella halophila]